MTLLRTLEPGDEAALESFLLGHAASSMFLRSNMRAAGLVVGPEPLQGVYVAAFEDGAIVGVAAHYWNGMVIVQAPVHLEDIVRRLTTITGEPVRGFGGTWNQVMACRTALGFDDEPTSLDGEEDLFVLELQDLIVPRDLKSGSVTCRKVRADEVDLVSQWHVDYCVESLGSKQDAALEEHCHSEMKRVQEQGISWMLEHDGVAVSYCAINAELPDCVQLGGVWTPPELRSRGFARCVVAGCLLDKREEGVTSSILFTPKDNTPAQRAYLSIGYRITGNYGLMMFKNPRPYTGSAELGNGNS